MLFRSSSGSTTSLGTDTNGADGWSASWNNMQVGSYSIYVIATDNDGATTTSAPITVSVNAVVPTTITLTISASNKDGIAGANSISASGTTTISCTVGVNCPQSGTFNKNSQVTITTISSDLNWLADLSSISGCMSSGQNSCTITDIDTLDKTISVVFDHVQANQPPSVSIISPSEGSIHSTTSTISLEASASDTDGTISDVLFFKTSNGVTTSIGSATYHSAQNKWILSWSNPLAGTYSITAKATDNAGGTVTSQPKTIIINTPPSIFFTSPSNGESYTSPATIPISVTATDPDSGDGIDVVEIYDGNNLINDFGAS